MSTNLDLVRSIYADWERGDFSRTDWADPEIEYAFHEGLEPGRWKGVAQMGEAWFRVLEAWEHYASTGAEYRELDDERVLMLTNVRAQGKRSGITIEQAGGGRGALLFHLRDGRVTKLDVYWSRERAFADLGVAPEGDTA